MALGHEQEPLAEIARLRAELERALLENQLLREKINLMLARLFDKSSESVDPSQLELVLDPDEAKKADAAGSADPGPAAEAPDATSDEAPAARTKRSPRKPRDTSHLHVEETVLIHDEVAGNPEAFREIERIFTDRFDYQPGRIFIHRTVRVVHVAKDNPDAVPLKPAAPPSLGLGATSRLVAYVTAAKYCHHRPHYRTQGIVLRRHGVHLPRHKLCHWDKVVAETIEPLYKLVHGGLLDGGNLQADETPVKYLDPGKGKTSTGYLWVIHAPRAGHKGDILYQWHTSRKAACLDELLGKNYRGNLQTDAYAGYPAWAAGKDGIDLSNCWAHARREFHEALKIGQRLAAGPLAAIQKIYRIETELRERGATADERAAVRRHDSFAAFENWRRAQGHRLVLAETDGATPLPEFAFCAGDIVLVGRESAGVTAEVHAAAEASLHIPMRAGLRSLNVARAAAMVMGEALRQTGGFPGRDGTEDGHPEAR